MENQNLAEEKQVNKNRTIMIAAAVAVALSCCCLLVGIAGYYAFTTTRSEKALPTQANEVVVPQETSPQSDVSIGDAPIGGLGNDILKQDTWQVIAPAAIGLGCDRPIGADSKIEVLQQPDASGVWVEKWTVMCNSSDTYAFEVEYMLDDTGATFNIKSLP